MSDFSQYNDEELWLLYADAEKELKDRKLVRTRNIVGERGEFLAIKIYNETPGLPNLQAAPEGTQNVDALSRKGERYSIKTITAPGRTTGVFYGIGDLEDEAAPEKKFEYAIVVQIGKDYRPIQVLEFTWEHFLKIKKWHSTMRAWNISLTKDSLKKARVIFDKST